MGTRRNAAANDADRAAFVDGCVELSRTGTGLTAGRIDQMLAPQVPGWSMRGRADVELSWWDLFSLWHYVAMELPTAGVRSNRAHGGPVFLPWHRLFLLRLEEVLQSVSGDQDFGLPYWDWAEDRQVGNPLWTSTRLGVNRGTVTSGPIGALRVQLTGRWTRAQGRFLEAHDPRPITRQAGLDPLAARLPRKSDVASCMDEDVYDQPDWDSTSVGFRNHLEGWQPSGMHNLVHMWLGGDMAPATSPNDPVFFLNHCNVDRIWQARMSRPGGLAYAPDGGGPAGHDLNDPLVALIGQSMTPAQLLDPSPWYDYDDLAVES